MNRSDLRYDLSGIAERGSCFIVFRCDTLIRFKCDGNQEIVFFMIAFFLSVAPVEITLLRNLPPAGTIISLIRLRLVI